MSAAVNQDIQDLLTEIIAKNGFDDKNSKITYDAGSQAGDGFFSRNMAVTVSDDQKVLDLFVKYTLDVEGPSFLPADKLYANEILFYNETYPAFAEFLREKNISDGFANVPKCYGSSEKNVIVLENLRKKGYEMCDKTKPLNDRFITMVFKTFAKFHAISFALKDQKPELYKKITALAKIGGADIDGKAWEDAAKENINNFVAAYLDPIKDKHILSRTEDLAEKLIRSSNKYFFNPEKTEYDILTQGDAWCNNVMFLFEENNKQKPLDIIILDWQVMKCTLPVYDLLYFFYSGASEEAIKNVDHYLKLYHDELSQQLKKMGSDSAVLYPYSVFEQHWKDNAIFGFSIAFTFIRIMLSEEDEHADFETMDVTKSDGASNLFKKIRNNDEYYRRLKIILEHMVDKNYL